MQNWKMIAASSALLGLMAGAIATGRGEKPESTGALAGTPPMGWNSYDAYGTTIDEAQFRANANWFAAHLKPFGWQYLVIDAEWYVSDPIPAGNSKTSHYSLDEFGRYTPATGRFPSAAGGADFKPLADYVHSLGLKFGIHMIRGIPRQAVEKNLPIAGTKFHAAEAADTSDTCPWNYDNYGLANTPAGQAYYDSVAQLYASWGVDLIKADCISSHPYKGGEIRMLSGAVRATGRPIVLSLSPGPAPIEKAEELARYAQMWRISDDIWDLWHSTAAYPQGLGDQFVNAARWAQYSGPGHWPDADMLPLGALRPAPGWGEPRQTRLTHNEQRTMLTLWCIFRSPLMIGGELPAEDAWTTSLLSNPEVIAVDQASEESHPVLTANQTVIWLSKATSRPGFYMAVFNLAPDAERIHYGWKELELPAGGYRVRDLWERKDIGQAQALDLQLPPHGSALYALTAR